MPTVELPFNCTRIEEEVQIGKINRTSWSVVPQAERMNIIREGDLAKVSIEITVNFLTNGNQFRQSQITSVLNEGVATKVIMLEIYTIFVTGGSYSGTIKINSIPKLPKETISPEAEVCRCPTSQMSMDFLNLLENTPSFSDVILKCGDIEIPAHKCILMARSPVFAAMFTNEMQESVNGIVNIVDMEPDAVRAMLRHLYSGKSDHLNESLAADLLFAADKYELKGLKTACIATLKSSMSPENIIRILVLGDLHDKGLRESAIEFICNCDKFSGMEKNEEWKLLRADRPNLAMDVLTSIVNYVQEKWRRPVPPLPRRSTCSIGSGRCMNRLQLPPFPSRLLGSHNIYRTRNPLPNGRLSMLPRPEPYEDMIRNIERRRRPNYSRPNMPERHQPRIVVPPIVVEAERFHMMNVRQNEMAQAEANEPRQRVYMENNLNEVVIEDDLIVEVIEEERDMQQFDLPQP